MKKTFKAISVLLTLIIVFSSGAFVLYSGAQTVDYNNKYPFVFVHGLNGWGGEEGINKIVPDWGATTGDLMKYLTRQGYECYSASVGPISSAWDRACELYAQLAGTTVDYGEAHSAAHNHRRFGRTYEEPLIEGWGSKDTNGQIKKIHLIGHSFGGTTIRLLTHLLTYGCPEEVKASKGDVSPLFTGGKENLIESITTIATPHNSATCYKLVTEIELYNTFKYFSAFYCATLGRSLLNGVIVDFHLEQFGISNTPGKMDADLYFKSIIHYIKNSDDTCINDLTPLGAKALNDMIKMSPNVYYFSYAFDATHEGELTGMRWPDYDANPVIAPIGIWIAHHYEYTEKDTGQIYDKTWNANDMLSNTESEKYPFDEPHTDYDISKVPEPGIWNVFPVQKGDHGQAVGLLNDRRETRDFYSAHAELLCSIEK